MSGDGGDARPPTVRLPPLVPGQNLPPTPARRGGIARCPPCHVWVQEIGKLAGVRSVKRGGNPLRKPIQVLAHLSLLTCSRFQYARAGGPGQRGVRVR